MGKVTAIILFILAFKSSRNEGADELPSIIGVTNKDVEKYGKMKCLASGDNINYTWKQFRLDNSSVVIREYDKTSSVGVTVDSDGTITFNSLQWDLHDGYYQCFVSNSKGTAFSRKIKLRIKNMSRFVFTKPIDLKEKDVGDIVTLSCPRLERPKMANSFGGSFGYSEYWGKHDGRHFFPIGFAKNMLQADGKLVFSPLEKKNCDDFFKGSGAALICQRDTGSQVRRSPGFSLACSEKQVDMEKKRKRPVWVQTPNQVELAVEGQTTSLTCISEGVPTPDVTWYFKNETKITSGINGYELPTSKFNRNLIIESVMKSNHEGNYTCRAKSTEGDIVVHTYLKVQVRPRFTVKLNKKLIIDMNAYGFLKCEAYAVPRASYSWWKNGQELIANRGKMILELSRVNITSSGVYQCVAENLVGMEVTSTKVEVKTQVPLVKKFGPFFLFNGTTRELTCQTDAIPEVHRFFWFHNGMQIKNNSLGRHFLSRSGTLLINDVRETDGGKYRCMAINTIGNGSAETQAVVYRQTIFKVLPNDTSVQEGGDFYLFCGAIQDKRLQLQYRWQKDGVALTSKERHIISVDRKVSRLRVLRASLSDEGVYECVASTRPHKFEIKAIATVKIRVPRVSVDVNVIPFAKYILLRWGPPTSTYGDIKSYSVGIRILANQTVFPELGTKVKSNQLEHLFKNLDYSTRYIVGVAAENNAGIGPAFYLKTTTVTKTVPAKPAVPVLKPVSTSSVNVTYEYGYGGGYPLQFVVKYKKAAEKVKTRMRNDSYAHEDYLESNWQNTSADRWIEIKGLSRNTLYEFRTVGRNDLGSGMISEPAFGEPTTVYLLESKAFYTTSWFIALMVLVVLIVVAFAFALLMWNRGGKYNVEERESKRGVVTEACLTEENVDCHTEPKKSNLVQSSCISQTSIDEPEALPESDESDSLECYGEGEEFNDDGSFIEDYGEKIKLDPIGGTFV